MRIKGVIYSLIDIQREETNLNQCCYYNIRILKEQKKTTEAVSNDTQERDKCAFPPAVVPVESGISFLPAHPSCSLAPGSGDLFMPSSNPLPSKHTKTGLTA